MELDSISMEEARRHHLDQLFVGTDHHIIASKQHT